MTVGEIIEKVARDQAFYDATGGGLTLSGGEPLAQADFAFALLTAAKERGIHTCIETSGYASQKALDKVLPVTDLFLFDIKGIDEDRHKKNTGASNRRILRNLDRISTAGKPVILRCPLIPGVNDSDSDLAAIAALANRYRNIIKTEIMAYHNFGVQKAYNIGRNGQSVNLPNADAKIKETWVAKIKKSGYENVAIG
jgi:pyruvate formate lyase activating enzyme